jgi:hypothetical protein
MRLNKKRPSTPRKLPPADFCNTIGPKPKNTKRLLLGSLLPYMTSDRSLVAAS